MNFLTKNRITLALSLFISLSANALDDVTEQAQEDPSGAADMLDNEIIYWTKRGELNSVKKTALSDELESTQISTSIIDFKSERAALLKKKRFEGAMAGDSGNEISSPDVSELYMSKSASDSNSQFGNNASQTALLSQNSDDELSDKLDGQSAIERKMEQLEKRQKAFFNRIQEFLGKKKYRNTLSTADSVVTKAINSEGKSVSFVRTSPSAIATEAITDKSGNILVPKGAKITHHGDSIQVTQKISGDDKEAIAAILEKNPNAIVRTDSNGDVTVSYEVEAKNTKALNDALSRPNASITVDANGGVVFYDSELVGATASLPEGAKLTISDDGKTMEIKYTSDSKPNPKTLPKGAKVTRQPDGSYEVTYEQANTIAQKGAVVTVAKNGAVVVKYKSKDKPDPKTLPKGAVVEKTEDGSYLVTYTEDKVSIAPNGSTMRVSETQDSVKVSYSVDSRPDPEDIPDDAVVTRNDDGTYQVSYVRKQAKALPAGSTTEVINGGKDVQVSYRSKTKPKARDLPSNAKVVVNEDGTYQVTYTKANDTNLAEGTKIITSDSGSATTVSYTSKTKPNIETLPKGARVTENPDGTYEVSYVTGTPEPLPKGATSEVINGGKDVLVSYTSKTKPNEKSLPKNAKVTQNSDGTYSVSYTKTNDTNLAEGAVITTSEDGHSQAVSYKQMTKPSKGSLPKGATVTQNSDGSYQVTYTKKQERSTPAGATISVSEDGRSSVVTYTSPTRPDEDVLPAGAVVSRNQDGSYEVSYSEPIGQPLPAGATVSVSEDAKTKQVSYTVATRPSKSELPAGATVKRKSDGTYEVTYTEANQDFVNLTPIPEGAHVELITGESTVEVSYTTKDKPNAELLPKGASVTQNADGTYTVTVEKKNTEGLPEGAKVVRSNNGQTQTVSYTSKTKPNPRSLPANAKVTRNADGSYEVEYKESTTSKGVSVKVADNGEGYEVSYKVGSKPDMDNLPKGAKVSRNQDGTYQVTYAENSDKLPNGAVITANPNGEGHIVSYTVSEDEIESISRDLPQGAKILPNPNGEGYVVQYKKDLDLNLPAGTEFEASSNGDILAHYGRKESKEIVELIKKQKASNPDSVFIDETGEELIVIKNEDGESVVYNSDGYAVGIVEPETTSKDQTLDQLVNQYVDEVNLEKPVFDGSKKSKSDSEKQEKALAGGVSGSDNPSEWEYEHSGYNYGAKIQLLTPKTIKIVIHTYDIEYDEDNFDVIEFSPEDTVTHFTTGTASIIRVHILEVTDAYVKLKIGDKVITAK